MWGNDPNIIYTNKVNGAEYIVNGSRMSMATGVVHATYFSTFAGMGGAVSGVCADISDYVEMTITKADLEGIEEPTAINAPCIGISWAVFTVISFESESFELENVSFISPMSE